MDDNEYYAMMRRQYSHTDSIIKGKKNVKTAAPAPAASQTPGTYKELEKKYGHEDADMFIERNNCED